MVYSNRLLKLESCDMRFFFPLALTSILVCSSLCVLAQTPVAAINQDHAAPQVEVRSGGADFCDWLPTDIPHAQVLRGVCQYAITLPEKMPNFICEQATSRYIGDNSVPIDLVTASVRYEDGNDYYSDIKVNGQRTTREIAQSSGLWSTGEFGSNNLRSIFDPRNEASFSFRREGRIGDHEAWVFTYRIAKQNDALWRLRAEGKMVAPPYHGEVWVDAKTGAVLRFRSIARDLPEDFPMSEAEQQIDYEKVAFEDGSSFVLPMDFTVLSTFGDDLPIRNMVRLRNFHEFRAKARMIFDAAGTGADISSLENTDAAQSERELEENNEIYTILREQALREDAAGLKDEQSMEINAASVGALWKLATLEKQEQKTVAKEEMAKSLPPVGNAGGEVTTFKASAKLVQVSVVLRDPRGHAVGSIQKDDFRLFDDRKPQAITSFSVERLEKSGEKEISRQGVTPDQSGVSAVSRRTAGIMEQDVAYIFDDIHSAMEDFASAKEAAIRHIAELRPEDRAAIVSASGEVQVDFTNDRDRLLAAVRSLKAHPIALGSECPPVSYYIADLIMNKKDVAAEVLATGDTMACASVPKPMAERMVVQKAFEVLSQGNRESRQILGVLGDVIRRTAAMRGRRSIVLVSPGLLTVESDLEQRVTELIDEAIKSDIILNALDVRGLYTTGVDATNRNLGEQGLMLRLDTDEKKAVSDVMAEFASGTGGTFFENNNDLNEGFRRIADAPEYIYVLGFSPAKLDGKFHKLKVSLREQGRLKIQAREGYYAAQPASN